MKLIINKLILIIIIFGLCFWNFHKSLFGHFLSIYILDVGQGDSILLISPDGKTMLVDGGPDDSLMSEIGQILPIYNNHLDYLLLTHPDADHSAGLNYVLDKYDVGTFIASDYPKDTNTFRTLREKIRQNNLEFTDLRELDDFKFGCCVEINILWPNFDSDLNSLGEVNNISKSFELKYGNFNMFLGGDLDFEIENRIAKENRFNIDVLKVSHHGSSTSSSDEFLKRLDPEVALISVGTDNKYGHPAADTIQRFDSNKIPVFATSKSGRIELKTDGNFAWISSQKT